MEYFCQCLHKHYHNIQCNVYLIVYSNANKNVPMFDSYAKQEYRFRTADQAWQTYPVHTRLFKLVINRFNSKAVTVNLKIFGYKNFC